MSLLLSPFYSDFESEEEAESYDRWFRAKVQAALDDPSPGIPHEEAMVLLDQLLEERRKNRHAAA
ncbi:MULTISPECIES: type II toxin-antitoxin system RelB family antitoxin [unclassified Pseudomonas]|uniref:type II toxin-antitoxin system RelB family antitoxin n=1 Tax=unclassified Pseudomonas TaxID=196821 RepID=UPI001912A3ED|nr:MULTISPECIES: stability determinant [unclassified Pseudomonas]MBK5373023.1 stability determinant [Pseudomonas sp. TH43]MBK5511862.1 stability determinant [Pseudomonas sp. TH15]